MDDTTKQRLIGAIVLVIAALWIVPIFLDGPSQESQTISETIELPGIDAQPNQQTTIQLTPAAGRAEEPAKADEKLTMPAQPAANETPPESQPQPVAVVTPKPVEPQPKPDEPQPKATTPKAAVTPEPAQATQSAELWAVQLGSFSDRENAEALAAELRKAGFAAFISEHARGATVLLRVRIGPLKDRAAAEQELARLAAKGHKGQVVRHP